MDCNGYWIELYNLPEGSTDRVLVCSDCGDYLVISHGIGTDLANPYVGVDR